MTEITKCLNEWNATIEALGQGKQTILIRSYGTTINEFLLFPTTSYTNKEDILDSFQDEYKDFVNNNLFPKGDNKTYEVKYYAKVEKVLDKLSSRIGVFNKYHIWTGEHVRNYLKGRKAYIWVLRVYKLNEPQILKRSNGMIFANVNKGVKLEGNPVISEDEFNKIKEKILNTK